MFGRRQRVVVLAVCGWLVAVARGGPYTEGGVNGYIGDDWRHADPLSDPNARVNPMFRGWATGFKDYRPADDTWTGDWNDPNKALGPAMPDTCDIVSLGDLDAVEIADGCKPGHITLVFGDPCLPGDSNHIRDVNGYDFAVFENGFMSLYNTGGGSVRGEMIAELARVEVSSDGVNFARFGGVSLTPEPTGPYGTIEISDVLNLAGKYPNAFGICTGTPFDLRELAGHSLVRNGTVDINDIAYVRIVDIPGSGDFLDAAVEHIDPCSWPSWANYDANHAVYDAWVTWGSGGFDLDAVGVLKEQQYSADINLNGVVDGLDFALFASAWDSHFGQTKWIGRCDLDGSSDLVVDWQDLKIFVGQWLKVEQWRQSN
ncbi:MAG: hypothetical protein ACYTEL_03875 [Planctomycetota bacterium]|jgi:hypothetical protein